MSELLPRAIEPGFDGLFGNSEGTGSFGLSQPFDRAQHQNLPQFLRQVGHGTRHPRQLGPVARFGFG